MTLRHNRKPLVALTFAMLRLLVIRLHLGRAMQRLTKVMTASLLCCVGIVLGAALPQANASIPHIQASQTIQLILPHFVYPKAPPEPPIHLPAGRLLAEHHCLTELMFYEARGEGREGQKAVAEVVFNRLNSGRHGASLCSVIYEGVDGPTCQFTFACEVHRVDDPYSAAWQQATELAALILIGEDPLSNETDGATNYHATSVEPYWIDSLVRTTQIGEHIFYRTKTSASRNGLPALRTAKK